MGCGGWGGRWEGGLSRAEGTGLSENCLGPRQEAQQGTGMESGKLSLGSRRPGEGT